MSEKNDLLHYATEFAALSAEERLGRAFHYFTPERVVLASSVSVEDQVLTHMAMGLTPGARIFTLDTGRLPQETYDTMERTMEKYGFRYEVLAPDAKALEALVSEHGPNPFYRSLDLRKLCCKIRKTDPLKRVLATADLWICGLRQGQSPGRADIEVIEWDEAHELYKLNPLFDWTEERVWDYVRSHNIPHNPLQAKGYRSLGCQPCTRAIGPGDDLRSGRWWWEDPNHKECGLHGRCVPAVARSA